MLVFPLKKLLIWQKAMALAKHIYILTRLLPKHEMYGLTSQMRRAAASVPSNIAEGSQRASNKEFANFISIARGSLAELETQCILASEIGYISTKEADKVIAMIRGISRMISSFAKRLITDH